MMLKTTRVVPVAVHLHRKTPLKTNLKLAGDHRTYLDFSCISCVLHTKKAKDYPESGNVAARLCLPFMAHAPAGHMLVAVKAYEGLAKYVKEPAKREKYFGFISNYAEITKFQEHEFYEEYVRKSPYNEDIMTLGKIWRERAIAEGEATGKVKIILVMYKGGDITAGLARAQLERLAKEGSVPQELVKKALAEIGTPKA